MKILLTAINAKYIHSNPAVYVLKACCLDAENLVEIAEYTINHRMEDVLADLYDRRPDVLAFSCYIWNWEMIQALLAELPKVLPDTDLWLGGPEVSYDAPEVIGRFPQLTGVMVGEGEITFRNLVALYRDEVSPYAKLAQIPGIVMGSGFSSFASGGLLAPSEGEMKAPHNAQSTAPEVLPMDEIPFFYGDLEQFENRIMYYETSRGCPFRCSYCLSSIEKTVRLRSLDLVYPELQFFLDHKVPQVKFIDRTFNCNRAHAMGIWRYILEHDNGITNFHFEVSADLITQEQLELMRQMRPGLIQLEIGVQSTNPATIQEIHRTMNLEKLREMVAAVHSFGNIHQHLDLIAGLPYEDYDRFALSFNDVYAMRPDQLQLGFLKVLKGSYMEAHAADYGMQYRSTPPYEILSTNWLDYGQVRRLKLVEEMVELYYNSFQFQATLELLVPQYESPFDFFQKLGDFYQEKGYLVNKPARSYRYEVLLEFATERLGEQHRDHHGEHHGTHHGIHHEELLLSMLREALTYDMYLRENCKSRPSFATSLSSYKQQIYALETDRKEHWDVFQYPVWDAESCLSRLSQEVEPKADDSAGCDSDRFGDEKRLFFVAFNYDNRNPLNHNASVRVVRTHAQLFF